MNPYLQGILHNITSRLAAVEEHMEAFPTLTDLMAHQGMELRDYFAAKAMQGMNANTNDDHDDEVETYDEYCDEIAKCAYKMADAMMEARKK